jgi:hypothetical protein
VGDQPSRASITWRQAVAWCGLAVLFAGCLLIVISAASAPPGLLVGSHKWTSFPGWLGGPFHGLFGPLHMRHTALAKAFSILMAIMTVAYFLVLWTGRSLSMRAITAFVLAVSVVLLLGPPLQLTDLWNYLAYARLGAVHHLNPYTHVINAEVSDPTYRLSTWHNWRSPYGTLFTAVTYPIAWLPLPAAYWVLKVLTVLLSLAFLWLVAKCARLLDRDPRLPVLIIAASPIYLIYALAEFHNDFFMLVPSMASIALLLTGRYRAAGVAVAAAVAVKVTMILLLPFLLVAAWRRHAWRRLLAGVVLGAVPLIALSLALFGPVPPNVSGQSRLLTPLSVPNLLGWAIGLDGGTPGLVRDMNVLVVAVVGYELLRRRDWLSGAGWATLALLISLGWLMPWYVIWLLPLAGLATSVRLRQVALLASVFLIVTFMPYTSIALHRLEINPAASPVGQSAWKYQWNAQFWRPHLIPPWVRAAAIHELRRCHRTEPDCDMTLHGLETHRV